LTTGLFYNHEFGAQTVQPQLWPMFPHLRYDTFVTQAADPNVDSTFIAPLITAGFPDAPQPVVFSDTHISIVFGAQGDGVAGPGEFTVARLTFRNDTTGTIVGRSVVRPNGVTVPFAFTIPVPEPRSAAVAVAGTCACGMRRRHRRGTNGIGETRDENSRDSHPDY
jgi:hypothetical protein